MFHIVSSAGRRFTKSPQCSRDTAESFVISNVIPAFGRRCHAKSNTPTEEYSKMAIRSGSILQDIERLTLNALLTSRHADTQENGMRKALTPWKNGRRYADDMQDGVLTAIRKRSSRKITSFLYRRVGLITSRTFNPFAVHAIAANGVNDIYENPDLLPKAT